MQTVTITPSRPKLPVNLELATTLDRTGSSQTFSNGIQKVLGHVFSKVGQKVSTLEIYLQSHGDLDYGEDHILHVNKGTATEAETELSKIAFEGGGDAEETHLDAIEHLLATTPFKTGVHGYRQAIVAVMTGGCKPARSGKTPREIGHEMAQRGILFFAVASEMPEIRQLVEAANGLFFPITNDPPPTVLERITADLGKSILASVQAAGTKPLP